MNLEIFKNENFEIRVAVDENNEPLFCLADVCRVLEIQNSSDVKKSIKSEFDDYLDLIYPILDNLGREQNATFITEPQLYFVLMRSDKLKAKPFRKWINCEILPTIRKHGGYLTDAKIQEVLSNPDTIIKLATDLKAEREKRKALELEKEANTHYISFAKSVEASATSALIGDFIKTLCDENDVRVGRNRIFKWLRDEKYLMKDNIPFQKWLDAGYFEVIPQIIITTKGNKERFTTRITAKGQVALSAKICEAFKKKVA
ncbi:phage antirepressor KilAC domain-containing protein [Campylobacter sp. faydin G-24]|uniref:Phage antirepressor KilAC domain-containing protein n=1 Tax=Campylobacter anatolicus TaxID=2829105 RepID=A0ABS5HJJ3_9BACT|nr:phage antirepressor KilAC domain-containing protein [Campylobacter anatolicus]MBR8464426.1 phage antirepressor KilAC domain-containing protein [Campylobacter anatolicus]